MASNQGIDSKSSNSLKATSSTAIDYSKKSADNLGNGNLLQVKKTSNTLNNAASSDEVDVASWKPVPNSHSTPIRSWQAQAPAPATTFYNLELHSKPEQLIIIREWPRRRFSQRYSHSIDPVTLSTEWQQFIKFGELEDKITHVFGNSVVDELKRLIQTNCRK